MNQDKEDDQKDIFQGNLESGKSKNSFSDKWQDSKNKLVEKFQDMQQNIEQKVAHAQKHIPSTGTTGRIKRIFGLFLKETKVLLNDKIAMAIAFLLPVTIIILLVTLGGSQAAAYTSRSGTGEYLGRGSPPNLPPTIGFIDMDDTTMSEDFYKLLIDYENTGFCEVVESDNRTALEYMLGKHQINAIIVVPPLFEYNLTIHFPTILTIVYDTIDTMTLQDSQAVIDTLIEEFKQTHGFTGVFNVTYIEVGVPDDPGAKTLFLSTPMFFPMILFSLAALTATQSIVSDIPKDRMVLTPTNKYEMLLAKTLAMQFIMIIIILITVSMSLGFGLPIRGSVFSFFAILFLISLSGVVWGLLVSALADVPLNALQYFIFFFLFQIIVLFFLEDPLILNWIPIHSGRSILMNVTLRGESVFLPSNFVFIRYLVIEIVIVYVLTQIIFNRQKTML